MSAKSTVIHDVGDHLRDLLRHVLRDDGSHRHEKTPGEACNFEREPHTEKMETDTKGGSYGSDDARTSARARGSATAFTHFASPKVGKERENEQFLDYKYY